VSTLVETPDDAIPQSRPAGLLRIASTGSLARLNAAAPRTTVIPRGNCGGCGLRRSCLPHDLSPSERRHLEATVTSRRRARTGDVLYDAGDRLEALYAVRAGHFKTGMLTEDGREQVTGFYMAGDILGLDGIDTGYHTSRTVALNQGEVCVISYSGLMETGRESQPLQRYAHRLMGREILRSHGLMLILGTMHAEERVATFLLHLSRQMQARGYSASEFLLRMTREDIGSFLGLRLETVSRSLSKLHDQGLIDAHRRHILIRDMGGLTHLVGR
jgi:CRP/FNR family transcriptional regulator